MSFEPIFHLNVTHRERVPSDSSVEDETKGFMETANEIRQHIQEFQNQELQLKFFRNRPDILKPRKSMCIVRFSSSSYLYEILSFRSLWFL